MVKADVMSSDAVDGMVTMPSTPLKTSALPNRPAVVRADAAGQCPVVVVGGLVERRRAARFTEAVRGHQQRAGGGGGGGGGASLASSLTSLDSGPETPDVLYARTAK